VIIATAKEDCLRQWETKAGQGWWYGAAIACLHAGHVCFIPTRNGRRLYLVRCWLTPPKVSAEDRFDSGDSVLLHYFAEPDDDGALHDHPWAFRTTVLSGGYWEELPGSFVSKTGPGPMRTDLRSIGAGATVEHQANDLHAVASISPETWTLVRTGPRVRDWGFHPAGKPWVGWREYLAGKQ
jgi:hypothetical protein